MTKNDHRIMMPEITATAWLAFNIPDLEALQEYFGRKYIATINEGLLGYEINVIKKMLEIGLREGDPAKALELLTPQELVLRLSDALLRILTGQKLDRSAIGGA